MAEPRDISEALREAVEKTVRASVDTRERAQGAVDDIAEQVDGLVKGAEKNISRGGRSVRAAVEERLPATQDDLKAMRADLSRFEERLAAIERRLEASAAAGAVDPAARPAPQGVADPGTLPPTGGTPTN